MRTIATSTALLAILLFIAPVAAQQQVSGTGQFCIKGPTGPVKCEYQTMAQCQQARPQGSADQCLERARAESTVGGPASPAQREQPSAPGEQKD